MEIEEEVERRRLTIQIDDPTQAYSEAKDLLNTRMSFNHVAEEQYYNDVDKQLIRSKIETTEQFDKHTSEKLEIYLKIDKQGREMDLQVQALLVTEYPEKYTYQKTLWYYAYRSLYDKFLYGNVRHGYEPAVEEKVDTLVNRLRENLEE